MILYVCAECGFELVRYWPVDGDEDCGVVWDAYLGARRYCGGRPPSPRDLRDVRCPRCGTVLNGAAAGLAVE